MKKIDISQFTEDPGHFGSLDLLITIKSFDLQAIRKRYLASRKRNVSGKAGSVERRSIAEGGIAALLIENGALKVADVLCKLPEPRAIDFRSGKLGFAAENIVYVLDGAKQYGLEDPWFSYIHTLNFSPWEDDKLLIASSGFDCIFEYEYRSGKKTYEWFAWEHGLNEAHDPESNAPFLLTRDPDFGAAMRSAGYQVLVITDPLRESLPTAKRAAFINSVCYDPEDRDTLLATLFHKGAVFAVSKSTGNAQRVLAGLKNPHGGRRFGNAYMGTSTAGGELVVGDGQSRRVYDFSRLAGKPAELGELEWIQNSIVHNDFFISIDSNRNAFVLIDPGSGKYGVVPFDPNWAVQDLVIGKLHDSLLHQLRSL